MESKTHLKKFSNNCDMLLIILLVSATLIKVIPHIPNFSPQIVMILYSGYILSKRKFLVIIPLFLLFEDLLFSVVYDYSAFGEWTYFTYSAYLMIGLGTSVIKIYFRGDSFIKNALLFSVLFWVWTNLGVWLTSGMYSKTVDGFIECFTLAIPFLINSLSAAILWGVIVVLFSKLQKTINVTTA